jgi:hypothetical protein
MTPGRRLVLSWDVGSPDVPAANTVTLEVSYEESLEAGRRVIMPMYFADIQKNEQTGTVVGLSEVRNSRLKPPLP